MIYNDWVELIIKELNVTDKEACAIYTDKEAYAIYKAMLLTRDILRINPAADNFMNKPE